MEIPTNSRELENRSLADLQRELPSTANPFLQESWMGAQARANARRVFELYKQLGILSLESVPITAIEKLEQWAGFWGIFKNPATPASGNIIFGGIVGTTIPAGTLLASSGNIYATSTAVNISSSVVSIASLTRIGSTAYCVLSSDTSLYDGMTVLMVGANESEYNGSVDITVTGKNSFSYTVNSGATTPATGTITVSFSAAVANIESQNNGQTQNIEANGRLTLTTPISGINNAAYVDQGAIGGGTDIETNSELLARLLDRVQNPVALFNAAAIKEQAKKVAGVTEVFVQEITPAVGQVTVYFIRGNDASPIPDGSEVATVKAKILEIKPAHTSDDDVIVIAPTPVNADFIFTALSPNTASMQSAIIENIKAYFLDVAEVGVAVSQNQYNAVVVGTIDPETGDTVQGFTLSSPSGSLGGGSGEYPVFNSAVFP